MIMKMLKILITVIMMMSLHYVINAGAVCKSNGHVLKCDRVDETLIRNTAEAIVIIAYCPKVVNFPKMATVTRLIITSTPMSRHDLNDQNIHAEIILNGKSCKKTKTAASDVKLTTTASTARTSTNSPITSSTILEAVIVTINKTWLYVSFGLITVIVLTCVVCCIRLLLKRRRRTEERTLNYHIADLESVTEFQ